VRTPLLFAEFNIFDVLQHQQQFLKEEIHGLDSKTVKGVPEEELVRELAAKYKFDLPVLIAESAYTSHREVEVDVSRDPMRIIFDPSRPFYIKGTEITFSVPFRGDPKFLRVRPTTFSLNPPRGEVRGQEIDLIYTRTDANAAAVKGDYEATLRDINQHLAWLRSSVDDFNSKIGQQILPLLAQRKQKVLSDEQMIAALGLPNRSNLPISTPVLPRRVESIQKSIASSKRWDVFISHASEDKDRIARPLAEALRASGISVWYDEFSLKMGDSLRGAIDFGLVNSRYGIVILSKSFFAKHWPTQELNGLFGREVGNQRVILPVWHDVSAEEVRSFSPMLADRVAAQSSDGLDKLVKEILSVLEK